MSVLIVHLNGERVGRLEQQESGLLQFSYDQSWIRKPDAIPLSRSLPLQEGVFTGKKAAAYFAGILPEEEPRRLIAKILGISERNEFGLLERIGGECAGAVSLLREGAALPVSASAGLRALSERELIRIVAELPGRPLMAGMKGIRLSLAGAQDKLPVIIHGNGICLPLGETPSTHILKPEPDRFPGLAANEIFCMTLARAVGLRVPETEHRLIGDKPCILVERFDRRSDDKGRTTRIHQEDFCQAMGYPPERKYQAEGGPTLRDCISLLREWSTAPVLDIAAFMTSLIFNVVIGNADAHGKNFSILYSGGERRLSPLYDLVSTLAWPALSRKLAMKIGACTSIHAFTAGDWQEMARRTGLGWPVLRERMAETCERIGEELDHVRDEIGEFDRVIADSLHKTIVTRSSKMLRSLAGRDR